MAQLRLGERMSVEFIRGCLGEICSVPIRLQKTAGHYFARHSPSSGRAEYVFGGNSPSHGSELGVKKSSA